MSDDGAGRKVQRLNAICQRIKDHGDKGVGIERLLGICERSLGISEKTARSYLRILERNREIKEDHGKVIFIASEYV